MLDKFCGGEAVSRLALSESYTSSYFEHCIAFALVFHNWSVRDIFLVNTKLSVIDHVSVRVNSCRSVF